MKLLFMFVILMTTGLVGAAERSSEYTDLTRCRMSESSESDPDAEIDSFRSICPKFAGMRVNLVGSDARSWIVLKRGEVEIDLREPLLSGAGALTAFPTVVGKKLEWRLTGGKPTAVIVRMGETPASRSILVVVGVAGDRAVLLGTSLSNTHARRIADSF